MLEKTKQWVCAITVDFDSLKDETVTLRERDSTEQRRVTVPELLEYLEEQIDG